MQSYQDMIASNHQERGLSMHVPNKCIKRILTRAIKTAYAKCYSQRRIMRLLAVFLVFLSFGVNAADWKGVYEGIELYKNKEVKGLSYQFLDLRGTEGAFLYDADISDDENGLICKIETENIVWSTSLGRTMLRDCGTDTMQFELILLLDYSSSGDTEYSLKSDVKASLISHSNGISVETSSMWLQRTDDKSLLDQLKQTVTYE